MNEAELALISPWTLNSLPCLANAILRHLDSCSRARLVNKLQELAKIHSNWGEAPLGWQICFENGRKFFVEKRSGWFQSSRPSTICIIETLHAYDVNWILREWNRARYYVHQETGFWRYAEPWIDQEYSVCNFVESFLRRRPGVVLDVLNSLSWCPIENVVTKVERKYILQCLATLVQLSNLQCGLWIQGVPEFPDVVISLIYAFADGRCSMLVDVCRVSHLGSHMGLQNCFVLNSALMTIVFEWWRQRLCGAVLHTFGITGKTFHLHTLFLRPGGVFTYRRNAQAMDDSQIEHFEASGTWHAVEPSSTKNRVGLTLKGSSKTVCLTKGPQNKRERRVSINDDGYETFFAPEALLSWNILNRIDDEGRYLRSSFYDDLEEC
eukprot:gnl/MRDRNA2_/MRDRNA2_191103_c0_seq1.p1 gnl/MRDRNA2_/MRDRNA2_191103_c0~~gnl/MRDRNA2_/MRDRNA2_191103_c0_seq1.p1  ORF type:complete len:381 (+),score=29.04 gnl/MRDRNA2_/MRDRNA2_191103_c0_seq1:74-1216(+)